MNTRLTFLSLLSVPIMAGCNSAEPPATNETPGRLTSTLLDAQLDSLEKAKGVEQSLQEATKDRSQQMEDKGI